MKKILTSLLLTAALAVSALGISVSAAEGGTAYGKVPATDTKITIDGKKDAIYDKGLAIKDINYTTKEKVTPVVANAKVLWNGTDTLYCYVEVEDSTIIDNFDPSKGVGGAYNTDCVELFLDYSNTVARDRDQYRIDVAGNATFHDGKTTYIGADIAKYGFAGYAAAKTDKGYAVEFQIKAYNEPMKAGNLGFHIMFCDMYKEGTTQSNHSDSCANTPAKFGYVTLTADKVAVDAPKAAAATADPMTIALVSLAAASGAAYVAKKRK